MKIKSLILTGAGILAISAFSVTAIAMPTHNDRQAKHSICNAACQKIRKDFHHEVAPLKQELRASKAMLKARLLQSKLNTKKINKLVAKTNELRNKIFTARVKSIIQIKKTTGITLPLRMHKHKHKNKHHGKC